MRHSSLSYRDIVDLKDRMDFEMTAEETLVKLVYDAKDKANKMREDLKRFRESASKLANVMLEEGLIFTDSELEAVQPKYNCAVGIDGSFQIVGGLGGKWYAPISVARIIYEKGLEKQPKVDVFWAHIQDIDAPDEYEAKKAASIQMLSCETKAILNWGVNHKESYVFIDGPIVDPPVMNGYNFDENYISDRCEAIRRCLENSSVIGCVKRTRDKFYIDYLKNRISVQFEKERLDFPSDQHLIAHVFANIRRSKGYYGPLFTKLIDISTVDPTYEQYANKNIFVGCLFFQKDLRSQILRIDIPFLYSPVSDQAQSEALHIIKAIDGWTYPGHGLPVPVLLAHEKCNIREGCAKILYEEIMTGSMATDPVDQLTLLWMR